MEGHLIGSGRVQQGQKEKGKKTKEGGRIKGTAGLGRCTWRDRDKAGRATKTTKATMVLVSAGLGVQLSTPHRVQPLEGPGGAVGKGVFEISHTMVYGMCAHMCAHTYTHTCTHISIQGIYMLTCTGACTHSCTRISNMGPDPLPGHPSWGLKSECSAHYGSFQGHTPKTGGSPREAGQWGDTGLGLRLACLLLPQVERKHLLLSLASVPPWFWGSW